MHPQTQALYRGNGANIVRLVPDIAFKFVVHDQFKVMFTPADGSALGVLERFAAGAATGVCTFVRVRLRGCMRVCMYQSLGCTTSSRSCSGLLMAVL